MNLEAREMEMVQTIEIPECPLFGEAFDENEEDCINCIDAEDCKMRMESKTKNKEKKEKTKNNEKKEKTKNKKVKKEHKIEIRPPKVFGEEEYREYSAATLYSEYSEFSEDKNIVKQRSKQKQKSKEKGMKKPPLFGRGGKGNTTSYIEWLLVSGKWNLDEMSQKATYYLNKHGNRPIKGDMNKYIKACISWFKKNKGVQEIVSEDGKIRLTL